MNTMNTNLFGLPTFPEKIEDYIEIRRRYKKLHNRIKNFKKSKLSEHMQGVRRKSLRTYFSVDINMVPENIDIGELTILYCYFYGGICNFASIIDSVEDL